MYYRPAQLVEAVDSFVAGTRVVNPTMAYSQQ